MATGDIYLRTGPFVTRLETGHPLVRHSVARLYDEDARIASSEFSDFHITVASPRLRRWWRPTVNFYLDGSPLFRPAPSAHAPLIFEWGLNLVIATHAHQYLMVHAAVLERGGRAVIIPGPPGSGKSTLAAGLAHRGWTLLSDELALVEPDTGLLLGLGRPISLKNNSIDIIRRFAPNVVMSEPVPGTSKGTVALAKAPNGWTAGRAVTPAWIVFLDFQPGTEPRFAPRPKAESFIELAVNSMNYSILGERGFTVLGNLVDRSRCLEFAYGDLGDGVRCLTELADRD
jgi:HprK-related kinase A